MVRRIAVQNMKYHKSKNILIGIAIFLTTLLLFLVPTIGKDMIDGQFALINKLYPSFHALFRNVDVKTEEQLSVYHDILVHGLRSDVGNMVAEDAEISMMYLDAKGLEFYNMELKEGSLPKKENEIVVSKGILAKLRQRAKIGDTVTIPYQVLRGNTLDFAEEKQFVVTGFLEDQSEDQTMFASLVSEELLKSEVPAEKIRYRYLFQVETTEDDRTDEIENRILELAERFGIPEEDVKVNSDYLMANYVDPVIVPVIIGIMCIIVFAGVVTIYSIYYVGISERVREFGKIKAMGATKKQLKNIVLWEGISVAMIAMPIGLIFGSLLTKVIIQMFVQFSDSISATTLNQILESGELPLYHMSLYLLAVVITLLTVRLGLQKPMSVVSKISEIEAIRYQGNADERGKGGRAKKVRKSNREMSVFKLAKIYIIEKKKNSFITVFAMSLTGIFVVVVATVLACADPKKSADNSLVGQYEVVARAEFGNREHPEREWSNVIENNPLTEELKQQIRGIEGVLDVIEFTQVYGSSDTFGDEIWAMRGVPKECMDQLLNGITEGSATYEDLKTGKKCILDKNMFFWFPELQLGDILTLKLKDKAETVAEVEIIAIGDYPSGFSQFGYMLMANEGLEKICQGNLESAFSIFAKEKYNEQTMEALEDLTEENELLGLHTWKEEYETWKSGLSVTTAAAYSFLGILGTICIMNVINTMIHSVHIRKKEIGMMQAMGMSNHQLVKMLRMEGLFYTAGTLILSVGLGSILGYPVYLTAKDLGWFNISEYHYPFDAVIVVTVILFVVQMLLAGVLGGSVKKESLIERIRYSE
ncbi:MAG: ABC transporter permease [Roseburia sp.]|nr:ABC transporter permease [Roseburia sp.]